MGTSDEVGGLHLVGEPEVDRAESFAEDDMSDTAELPRIPAHLLDDPDDPLVAPPGSGMAGWSGRFRGALAGCARPLLIAALLCAGPIFVFVGRVSDTVVAAPVLSDLAGGVGLLLLPAMWLAYLALAGLPIVLCLTAVVAVLVIWAPEGAQPSGFREVIRTGGHRLGPLWAWLGTLGAVVQARTLISDDLPVPVAVAAAVVLSGFTAFLGVLGCVVLFERHRGPRRALRLLAVGRGGPVTALGVAGFLLGVLPVVIDVSWGSLAASVVTIVAAPLWAVAALLTYAQARRGEGRLTSAQLRRELSL